MNSSFFSSCCACFHIHPPTIPVVVWFSLLWRFFGKRWVCQAPHDRKKTSGQFKWWVHFFCISRMKKKQLGPIYKCSSIFWHKFPSLCGISLPPSAANNHPNFPILWFIWFLMDRRIQMCLPINGKKPHYPISHVACLKEKTTHLANETVDNIRIGYMWTFFWCDITFIIIIILELSKWIWRGSTKTSPRETQTEWHQYI